MRFVNWLRDLYSIRVPQKYDIFIAMAIVTAAFLAFVIAWHPAARLVQGPPGQPGKDGRNATKTAQPNAPPGRRTTVTPYGSGQPFTPTPAPAPTAGGQLSQPRPSDSPKYSRPTRSRPTEQHPSGSPSDRPPSTPATPRPPDDDPPNSPAPPSGGTGQPPATSPHSDRPTFTETAPDPSYTG